ALGWSDLAVLLTHDPLILTGDNYADTGGLFSDLLDDNMQW
ncbi:hypothetical protein Rin_00022630, partial [Candidatus Regiella insecticola 5.15]